MVVPAFEVETLASCAAITQEKMATIEATAMERITPGPALAARTPGSTKMLPPSTRPSSVETAPARPMLAEGVLDC